MICNTTKRDTAWRARYLNNDFIRVRGYIYMDYHQLSVLPQEFAILTTGLLTPWNLSNWYTRKARDVSFSNHCNKRQVTK